MQARGRGRGRGRGLPAWLAGVAAGVAACAEMAFRATGVGTAPHTGTNSFGAKEFAENSGT
ncbi:MAG: hypothetical protein RR946_10475, partial [Clostridia bacterium]